MKTRTNIKAGAYLKMIVGRGEGHIDAPPKSVAAVAAVAVPDAK